MNIDIHKLKSRYDGIPIDLLLSKTFNKDQTKNTIKNVVENKFNGKIIKDKPFTVFSVDNKLYGIRQEETVSPDIILLSRGGGMKKLSIFLKREKITIF